MRSESAFWKRLRPVFVKAKLDPVRVDNPVCPGTPDLNLSDGRWIELKSIERWPVNADTNVTIPHFTLQQRVWLLRRWRYAPGTTHLLLEVRSAGQVLLFDGDVAAKYVGRSNGADHRRWARAVIDAHKLDELPGIFLETAAS